MAYFWSLMGMVTLVQRFLPPQVSKMIKSYLKKAWKFLSGAESYCSFQFPETTGRRSNHLYRVVQRHLQAKGLFRDADELCLSRDENEKGIHYNLAGLVHTYSVFFCPFTSSSSCFSSRHSLRNS